MMTANLNLQKKLGNEHRLLSILPLELWREVDGFTDAKSHTFLRASCSFFRTWLTWEKDVEYDEYVKLYRGIFIRAEAFQSAVHLNPRSLKQADYIYLCFSNLDLEVFRICRLALQAPFSCAHIELNAEANYAIRRASQYGHTSLVQLLLQDPRIHPAAMNNYAIIYASQNGHHDVAELLLQDPRVNPAAQDNDAIIFASLNGHHDVVELLLRDPRVHPGAQDSSAIICASQKGHLAIVQLLLQDPRVDPTAKNNDALRKAFHGQYATVCTLLLSDPRVLAAFRLCRFTLPSKVKLPALPRPPKDIRAGPSGSKADRRKGANASR